MKKKIKSGIAIFVTSPTLILASQNCSAPFQSATDLASNNATDDPNGGSRVGTKNAFQCQDRNLLSDSPLRPLTKKQYINTVTALVGSEAVNAVKDGFSIIPEDMNSLGKKIGDLTDRFSEIHLKAFKYVAETLATSAQSDNTLLTKLAGACMTQASPTAECRDNFLRNFGLKAFRRPVLTTELATLQGVYQSASNAKLGVGYVLQYLLLSPDFLYRTENGGVPQDDGAVRFALSSYEIASRISYMIWDSMPDDALLAQAAADKLKDRNVVGAEIDRMLKSPLARGKIRDFYSFWLSLANTHNVPNSPAEFIAGVNVTGLREEMIEETLEYAEKMPFDRKAKFAELMTSNLSYARSPALASIYGHQPAPAGGAVPMEAGRAGFITRGPILASSDAETHPILRGVFIRQRFLCQNLGLPVDGGAFIGVDIAAEEILKKHTTRERWDLKTGPGTSCYACHQFINPTGFSLEGFDSLGRSRTQGAYYRDDGTVVARHAVRTDTNVNMADGTAISVRDATDMAAIIATSTDGPACFVRYAYRYLHQRPEQTADNCQLAAAYTAVQASDGSLLSAIKALVMYETLGMKQLSK